MMLFTVLSVVCYAGPIYDKARQDGIDLFNRRQYHKAAQQFIAVQNIAPVNNDLTQWLSKCNRKIALLNSKKTAPPPKKRNYKSRNYSTR